MSTSRRKQLAFLQVFERILNLFSSTMNLNYLHTISGLLIFIFLTCKVILHYYLDFKHKKGVGFIYSFISPLKYLKFCKKEVDNRYLNLQNICNFSLVLSFASLLLNIVIGVIIFYNYK